MKKASLTLVGFLALCGTAAAQPSLLIRFANRTNEITVAPGTAVPVRVYATDMPIPGLPLPGIAGTYAGFLSVNMDVTADTAVMWSGQTIPAGMGFANPPFGSAGIPSGNNVEDIRIGVGFGLPVTMNTILLWSGTVTVGSSDVNLGTLLVPVGSPPQTGLEIGLGNILPGVVVSHFISAVQSGAVIHVPAPAGMLALGAAGLMAAVRRRRA